MLNSIKAKGFQICSVRSARLILVEVLQQNPVYLIGQGFCRYIIVKVQERDSPPIFERQRKLKDRLFEQ